MSESLKFKNVFLTGGARGLGKGFVDALLGAGARVVFGDINATLGAETEREYVERYGRGNVRFIEFDVTDGKKFEEAFRTAVNHLGYVDLMVNNAGFMNESLWENMIQLNYAGYVRGTFMATEHMRKDKGGRGGRIINICSVQGLQDSASIPVYTATKHGVRGFTASLAIAPDVKELGIEYGMLCPGPSATEWVDNLNEKRVRYYNPIMVKRAEKFISSIDRVNFCFMKLLCLENMNGAMLHIEKHQMNFCIVKKVNLGEKWPVESDASASPTTVNLSLKTKNVFLTGGAQGLGKSYTDALLAAGARVVFSDINPAAGTATEQEFVEKYGRESVKFLELDVTDGPKLEEVFQTAVRHLGYVDLVVNNAGLLNETLWERTIDINLLALVRGTFLACEHMRKDKGGKGGRIINISSESGLNEELRAPVYCGTKQAVRSFTSSLALAPDLKELGIEYGILCPGMTNTDMILKADNVTTRHTNVVSQDEFKKTLCPVERIQSAFKKLVLLEDLNKAILYVPINEMNFYKMVKVDLGDQWPVPQGLAEKKSAL